MDKHDSYLLFYPLSKIAGECRTARREVSRWAEDTDTPEEVRSLLRSTVEEIDLLVEQQLRCWEVLKQAHDRLPGEGDTSRLLAGRDAGLGKGGKIREKDSHGNDPRNVPG